MALVSMTLSDLYACTAVVVCSLGAAMI